MNSLKRVNVLCGSNIVKRALSKEVFPPSQEPEIPAYQEKVGESVELRKARNPSLSWNVDLEQQSPVYENIEEEPVLTALVRHQYMKRLRESLHETSAWYDKSKDVGDAEALAHQTERTARALEQKALRSCMVAKLYIRSMLTIIEDIKKGRFKTATLAQSPRSDRSQNNTPRKCSSQKSQDTHNLISETPHSEQNNITPMKIPTIDEVRATEVQKTRILSDEDLNAMHSLFDSLPPDIISKPKEPRFTSQTPAPCLSLEQRLEQLKHVLPVASSEPQSLEISSTNTAQDSRLISPHKRKLTTSSRHKAKKMLKVSTMAQLAKKRISEVVLEDEHTLFQQRVAQVYKLEQDLQQLPVAQRSALEHLYTKLFGPGHNYYLELSEEKQEDITRRRIANLVVAELETYYGGEPKRIANKNLFKFLAKHITELIYSINICPYPTEVHDRVAEFFVNGRCIESESDIYAV